jgi:hypothetical protein
MTTNWIRRSFALLLLASQLALGAGAARADEGLLGTGDGGELPSGPPPPMDCGSASMSVTLTADQVFPQLGAELAWLRGQERELVPAIQAAKEARKQWLAYAQSLAPYQNDPRYYAQYRQAVDGYNGARAHHIGLQGQLEANRNRQRQITGASTTVVVRGCHGADEAFRIARDYLRRQAGLF